MCIRDRYYTLLADFVFEINLRWGTLGSAPGIADAILENFAFYWHTSGGIQGSSVLFDMQDQFELAPGTGGDNPTNGIITIHNTWKYNLDGSQITYYIKEIPSSNGIVTSNLESGDFFKPSYDNLSLIHIFFRRHFLLSTAVYNIYVFSAEPYGRAACVHSSIAASDNSDVFAYVGSISKAHFS